MTRQKKKSLPGVVFLLALVASAIALGVYGNKLLATDSRATETTSEMPPENTTIPEITNETITTTPTNSTQRTT
ncbi:MAG: hypothetical protein RMI56_00785 [Sulfolobales archaeon]|nr:hypothetical protein [Sulfolobales archaeon]MDW8082316.1 hypothetical protein [Sulfolobales archaeon]